MVKRSYGYETISPITTVTVTVIVILLQLFAKVIVQLLCHSYNYCRMAFVFQASVDIFTAIVTQMDIHS